MLSLDLRGTDITGIAENYKKGGAATPAKEETKTSTIVTEKSEEAIQVVSDGKRIFVSPFAKKIAEEKGINIAQVKGSGENGRIVKSDIENHTSSSQVVAPNVAPVGGQAVEGNRQLFNLSFLLEKL